MTTSQLPEALAWAAELHADHVRKGTTIPYVSHLLTVTALVLESGGSETEAVAAVLHDAIEDRPDGGRTQSEILRRFGPAVLGIVQACSDDDPASAERSAGSWRARKERYLEKLAEKDLPALRVTLADKVHNARAIARDLATGPSREFWARFNAPKKDQLWFYGSLVDALRDRLQGIGQDHGPGLWRLWNDLSDAVLAIQDAERPRSRTQPVLVAASVGLSDWKRGLAKPALHWKRHQSARALAESWDAARGALPPEVVKALKPVGTITPLFIIPEYDVPLPGGPRPSQNDAFVLGRTKHGLATIAVEGKVDEHFDTTMREWRARPSDGRKERQKYLLKVLGLASVPDEVRYQLVHRTASAVIEARRFHAVDAVMLVHSFRPKDGEAVDDHFEDFERFVALFGKTARRDGAVKAWERDGRRLWLGWATGAA